MFSQSKVEIDPAMQRDAGYYECQVIGQEKDSSHDGPIGRDTE